MSAPPTTLRGHLRTTMIQSLPLIGASLAQMGIGVSDTVMVAWLGTDELASLVLATQLWFVVWIVIAGFAFGLSPIIATALGRDDPRGVRRAMRMGIWCVTLWGLGGMVLLSQMSPILTLFQQEPHLVVMADGYAKIALWALIPPLILVCHRQLLTALEKTRVILYVGLFTLALNILLNWVLIFGNLGAPALGVNGSAWATLISNIAAVLLMSIYIARSPHTAKFTIFKRLHIPDWPMFKEINRIGAPIAATLIAETGLFWGSSLLMGWISVPALAAHGIVLQLASISFMFPLGVGQVATVRIGRAIGAGDTERRNLAAKSALLIGLAAAILAALIFVLAPAPLIRLFLDLDNAEATAVLTAGIPLLMIAAAFQFGDSLQVVALGVLRGKKDTDMPMIISVISYWVIALPTAYLLAFKAGLGGPGVWAGLGIGLSVAALLLLWRVWRVFSQPISGSNS